MVLSNFWKIEKITSLTATLTPNGSSVGGGIHFMFKSRYILLHSCLEQCAGILNCTSYMASTLAKSTFKKLTRIHWKTNDWSISFYLNDRFIKVVMSIITLILWKLTLLESYNEQFALCIGWGMDQDKFQIWRGSLSFNRQYLKSTLAMYS